ncbi:MAG: ATP-binding protein [candidate division KSB1 bacterium]|nr:ATP-binding protein [candidate division KSB1 bacterium]
MTEDVLESTRVAISILDAESRYIWINRAFTQFFNISRNAVIGKSHHSISEQIFRDRVAHPYEFFQFSRNSFQQQSPSERFMVHILPEDDLEERYVEYWTSPIKHGLYKGGRIEQFTDVTELKIILDDLMESERRQKQLLHHLTDYTFTVKLRDDKPVFTHHSQGCLSVTGYEPEDFILNPDLWFKIIHKEDENTVQQHLQQILGGDKTQEFEHRILRKDGDTRWVKTTIVPDHDESARFQSADGLVSDITALKEAEHRDTIRQRQLIQADKLATLGILVSGVAHEINNPNNFISLNASMIGKVWRSLQPILEEYQTEHGDFLIANMSYESAKDKIIDLLNGITKGSERIAKIVKSLKDYARQDKDTLNEVVDINKALDEAIVIVNNMIKKSTQSFRVEYNNNNPRVRGNFQKLEQVFINLISNACDSLKHTPKELFIQSSIDTDQHNICVKIYDSGIGIPQTDMEHIFDPFFTTKRSSGGTGLGLSIAYGIIKDHGGDLSLESAPHVGTTATVTLPAANKSEP